jgi:hypothetical protein
MPAAVNKSKSSAISQQECLSQILTTLESSAMGWLREAVLVRNPVGGHHRAVVTSPVADA